MEIATADIKDIEELTRVEIASKIGSFETNEDYAIDYESRFYRWQTYFDKQSPASSKPERIVLKAVADGRIIGYLAGHLTNRYELNAEIQSFYVLKEHQRKGIGGLLLSRFLNWLLSQNAKSLCVGIFPENPYKAFYLKYGGQYLNPHWIYWADVSVLQNLINAKR